MFLAAAGAGPVYRLLGKKDLGTTIFPPIETTLIDGDIAFPPAHWRAHTRSQLADVPDLRRPLSARTRRASRHRQWCSGSSDRGAGSRTNAEAARSERCADAATALRRCEGGERDKLRLTKANVYPNIPDPLLLKNGRRVTTPEQWWSKRRPEIVADYEREILGKAPANLPTVTWEVVKNTSGKYRGIDVIVKHLVGHVDNSIDPQIAVNIQLVLCTPAHAAGPVPIVMELAFDRDFEDALGMPVSEAVPVGHGHYGVEGRPLLQRGWGFAVLSPTSFQPDDGSGLTTGIIGLMNHGQPRGLEDWGTLRAWSWGASRAMDYLETDPAVDAKHVGLEGHSRFGKTVLVAMAYDSRFAIVYSSSSGEGGAKLYRHIYGEQMPNVAGPELYHWFDGNFLRYGGPLTPADLPVDNHELIALCAPRPGLHRRRR